MCAKSVLQPFCWAASLGRGRAFAQIGSADMLELGKQRTPKANHNAVEEAESWLYYEN